MYCGTCGAELSHDIGCPVLLAELVEMRRKDVLSNWQIASFVELAYVIANHGGYTKWNLSEEHRAQLAKCHTAAQFGALFSKMIRERGKKAE